MLLKSLKIKNKGNASFIILAAVVMFSVLFVFIFDLCQIFIAREVTKNASDAASLAAAQNLLFLIDRDCIKEAEKVTTVNNCRLIECRYEYDEVIVTVEKELDFLLLDKLLPGNSSIKATSKAEVIYPWDEYYGYCKSYKFGY
jgi:secretion/DNA translocation related TadE-like protein